MTRTQLGDTFRTALAKMSAASFHRPSAQNWLRLIESDCPLTPCTMRGAEQNAAWLTDAYKLEVTQ